MESLKPWEKYWHDRVLLTIKQTSGPEKPLFITSDSAFKVLMKPLISTVREPSEKCVTQVATEMYAIFTESIKEHFDEHYSNRFPLALKEISELVGQIIVNLTNKTMNHINEAIAIEEGHITHRHLRGTVGNFELLWKRDEDFAKLNPFPKGDINVGLTCSMSERKEVRRVGYMLQVYYKAVANRIADTVAKATMTYMVHGLHKDMQPQLASQLGGRVKELLREDETTAVKRSQKEKELIAIQNSLQELDALNLEVSKKIDSY
ncbi:hypothetical protein FOCC_FOCC003844 [Frankliniella occidentalis]|nr:hypothetical protein FOCC_FOCC003844 [Frankliniella occidentalis]